MGSINVSHGIDMIGFINSKGAIPALCYIISFKLIPVLEKHSLGVRHDSIVDRDQ